MDDSSGDVGGSGSTPAKLTIVDTWLEPLADSACGDDLEYDNEFLEMTKASAGKPADVIGQAAAQPPDWRMVRTHAESLFDRTRDVRVAVYWARAMLRLEGASSLPDSLRLVRGLLERYWDEVHPRPDPDDGDPYARLNALNDMISVDCMAGDLREAAVIKNRAYGDFTGRTVEIAMGVLEPRATDMVLTPLQIEELLRDASAEDPELKRMPVDAKRELEALTELVRERVGYARTPDFKPLTDIFTALANWTAPAENADPNTASVADNGADGGGADASRRGRGSGLGDRIDSRADATRAIEMVCNYLERTEPTNPAQLLLRRAGKLINKNFLELVREFAPDAVGEVARVMGVSPEEFFGDSH
jgi:type VI secretion system protein ImpA